MNITSLLTPGRIELVSNLTSKKRVLTHLSEIFSDDNPALDQHDLLTAFVNRERLGSTAIGHGVGLPHVRSTNISQAVASFITLKEPVTYSEEGDTSVDLVFALIVPEHQIDEHLAKLAFIARLFSQEKLRDELRACQDADRVLETMARYEEKLDATV